MLTDLADVARSAGLTVAEAEGWRTRGHGAMNTPRTVTLHHTAGPATGDAPSLSVIRSGRPDLEGPLAHFLVARSGTVHVVAAGLCWHTGRTREPWQANAYSIGVECEHTGREEDPWPAVQIEAMRRLCRALCERYQIPHARVLGHKEIVTPPGRKIDPIRIDMRAFRAALAAEQEDPVPTADEIAELVWRAKLRNAFGDEVEAQQILVATEQRAADLQRDLAEARAELAALRDRLGG